MARTPRKSDHLLPERPEPSGDRIGYARVSREDQDLAVQIAALKRAGCVNIYAEKGSAVTGRRHQLALCKKDLQRGDTLVVWRLDRLCRSMADMIDWLKWLDQEGVHFLSLTESFDTSTAFGKFGIQAAAMFAELERNLTIERTKAKLQHLKEAGVHLGARSPMTPERLAAIKKDLLNPELTNKEVAKRNGIGVSSIPYYIPGGRRAVFAEAAAKSKRKR